MEFIANGHDEMSSLSNFERILYCEGNVSSIIYNDSI